MLIGYIRVSKSDGSQVLDLQRDALCEAGVAPGRVYEDLASGHKDDRPGFAACFKALQPGNTLVIWSLDRLGRDLKHLVGLNPTTLSRFDITVGTPYALLAYHAPYQEAVYVTSVSDGRRRVYDSHL